MGFKKVGFYKPVINVNLSAIVYLQTVIYLNLESWRLFMKKFLFVHILLILCFVISCVIFTGCGDDAVIHPSLTPAPISGPVPMPDRDLEILAPQGAETSLFSAGFSLIMEGIVKGIGHEIGKEATATR